jgi:hypothetical protein
MSKLVTGNHYQGQCHIEEEFFDAKGFAFTGTFGSAGLEILTCPLPAVPT